LNAIINSEKRRGIWRPDVDKPERIVAIEYMGGKPHAVTTEEHWDNSKKPWFVPGRDKPSGTAAKQYDFNWSKDWGALFYHNSGFGGDPLEYCFCSSPVGWICDIWLAEDVKIFRLVNRGNKWVQVAASRSQIEKKGYRFLAQPKLLKADSGGKTRNPFEVSPGYDDHPCIWCSKCKDFFPQDIDYSGPCEHLNYCNNCGYYFRDSKKLVDDERSTCDCEGC